MTTKYDQRMTFSDERLRNDVQNLTDLITDTITVRSITFKLSKNPNDRSNLLRMNVRRNEMEKGVLRSVALFPFGLNVSQNDDCGAH